MDNHAKWYMITAISQREFKVVESLKNRVISEGMEDSFEDFKIMVVPHLTPKELEKKKKGEDYKIKEKNLFPGYIFIKMVMTDAAWFMVRNTQYVTGLVGSSGSRTKPTPISNVEMASMEKKIKQAWEDFESGKDLSPFKIGNIVEVINGPTKGQIGPIVSLSKDRQVAIVELIMFERKTETEIPYDNLKIKE